MSVTRAEIANRALRKCGRLAYGQTAEANLSNAALQAYDEVYDYLEELGIVDWGSTAAVPNQYVYWIVALTALSLADELGVSTERYQRLSITASQAEPEIRRVYNTAYTPTEIKVKDY